jgi:hypothetical protein
MHLHILAAAAAAARELLTLRGLAAAAAREGVLVPMVAMALEVLAEQSGRQVLMRLVTIPALVAAQEVAAGVRKARVAKKVVQAAAAVVYFPALEALAALGHVAVSLVQRVAQEMQWEALFVLLIHMVVPLAAEVGERLEEMFAKLYVVLHTTQRVVLVEKQLH